MKVLHFLIPLFFLHSSCSTSTSSENKKKEEVQSTTIVHAKHFKITKKNQQTFVEIMDAESGEIQKKIDITQFTNSEKPVIAKFVTLSSTHIGMISKLNEESKIVGISGIQYVANKTVLSNFKNGIVIQLGEESTIPLEQIILSKANIIVYSGFGKEFPHQKQLEKLGIICLPNYDWKEIHPLGKAEWIKVFGVLLGKEAEANDYFSTLEKEYNDLKASAMKIQKSECLFSGNVFGDFWYTPAGESFNAQLFKDANCSYAYENTKGTGSLSLTLEEVLQKNADCNFWINPGAKNLVELKKQNPKSIYFQAFKQKHVYCYSENGNYFWEMSAIEPQKVLSDIIHITHPEMKLDKPLYFYTQLN